jgi:hypothetical protein
VTSVAFAAAPNSQSRFAAFKKSIVKADELNLDQDNTAIFGITKFADRTEQEMHRKCGGSRSRSKTYLLETEQLKVWDGTCYTCSRFPELASEALPTEFDWTTKGAVTPVTPAFLQP